MVTLVRPVTRRQMTDAGLTEEQFDGENYSIKVGERLRSFAVRNECLSKK